MVAHFVRMHPDEWQKWNEEKQVPITPNTSQESHVCEVVSKRLHYVKWFKSSQKQNTWEY